MANPEFKPGRRHILFTGELFSSQPPRIYSHFTNSELDKKVSSGVLIKGIFTIPHDPLAPLFDGPPRCRG
jgi:hypothetical protein